jgi:hypothetical protein
MVPTRLVFFPFGDLWPLRRLQSNVKRFNGHLVSKRKGKKQFGGHQIIPHNLVWNT